MSADGGARLGPYEILSPIGEGGMGEVYKARDTRLDRTVAIKKLKGEHSGRFEGEARAIAALNHPNICQIFDVGPDYLVMEYIDGQPLEGPLAVEDALRVAIQVASALETAHSRGVLHRDLKPANILVTTSGTAKLLDFGLAKMSANTEKADATRTLEGAVMGTVAYMAPEQAQGKPLDERSDIFSFGAVLYEMLSGRRAFDGGSMLDTMNAVVREDPAALYSPAASIVRRCLAKHPSERFQSMTELRKALEQVGAKPAEPQPSIAVLPFANMSAEKDEYFSDGLAEEIINLLTRIPGLKVIARTSAFAFRGKEQDIRRIAEALGVRTILEGSVRRSGNRIRVTAQLISSEDGAHLWSERYDREMADVFELQDEIAGAIATALKTKFTAQPDEGRQHTPDLAAYEAVLRARHYLNKVSPESMARARECLERAIALDPAYALPHSVLGGSFVSPAIFGIIPAHEAMPQACAAYQKALEIDPMLPEALVGLASISMYYDYNWKEAERLFGMALSRGPLPRGARPRYGQYLFYTARREAAMTEHELAVQGDPLNLQLRTVLASAYLIAGRYAEAASACRSVLEIDESYHVAHFNLSNICFARGDLAGALASAERAYSLAPWARTGHGYVAGLLQLSGDTDRSRSVLEKLGDGTPSGAALGFFYYYLVCSEIERAADWAEKVIEQREPALLFLLLLPLSKDLRRSSRWPALAQRMNLPELAQRSVQSI
jgi:serine/threonine-protein kinase